MSVMERKYQVMGIAMALILAGLILGYRTLMSDADTASWMPNDRANHHPKTATPSE